MPQTQGEVKILYKEMSRLWSYQGVVTPAPYCLFLSSKKQTLLQNTTFYHGYLRKTEENLHGLSFLDVYADH